MRLGLLLLVLFVFQCQELKNLEPLINQTSKKRGLTESEIISGLKEALNVGAEQASKSCSNTDGFWKNELIRIAIPPELKKVKENLDKIGLSKQVSDFEMKMNRAAEEASGKAFPIFKDAVLSMSFSDARGILTGSDSSATLYFRQKTYQKLYDEFNPVVDAAMKKIQLVNLYENLITKYNKIPFVEKVEFDLDRYICEKTLDGLFLTLKKEEKGIRKDPLKRVNTILKKVFDKNNW